MREDTEVRHRMSGGAFFVCAACGCVDDLLSFDESEELWFCEDCLDTDLSDPWFDLGEGG